jgi:hypothetical protein
MIKDICYPCTYNGEKTCFCGFWQGEGICRTTNLIIITNCLSAPLSKIEGAFANPPTAAGNYCSVIHRGQSIDARLGVEYIKGLIEEVKWKPGDCEPEVSQYEVDPPAVTGSYSVAAGSYEESGSELFFSTPAIDETGVGMFSFNYTIKAIPEGPCGPATDPEKGVSRGTFAIVDVFFPEDPAFGYVCIEGGGASISGTIEGPSDLHGQLTLTVEGLPGGDATLIFGETYSPGGFSGYWDGMMGNGIEADPGTYTVRAEWSFGDFGFGAETSIEVIEIDFKKDEVFVDWRDGSYDASANLADSAPSASVLKWRLSGASDATTIDENTGEVTFGETPENFSVVAAHENGGCEDYFEVVGVMPDIIGHKRGTMADPGDEVSEDDEDDPVNLLVGVNDDNDDNDPDPTHKDNEDTKIKTDDNDIVSFELEPLGTDFTEGTLEVEFAPADKLHVFNPDGTALLNDYSVDLANPSGDLEDLADNNPVTLYIEGLDFCEDATATYTYTAPDGTEYEDVVHLIILSVDLDVDSNNDWSIDASDDLVEEDTPGYKFWINDRSSYESVPNTYWESGFGGSSGDDNGDSSINGIRDLEDFAPVRIELDKDLTLPSGYRYQLEMTGPVEIRVFKRLSESYLTDLTEAQQQVQEQSWGVVSSAQPLVLDLNSFDEDEQYIIFEGVEEGQGTLHLVLRDAADQEICADEVELNLEDIRERYSRATTRNSFGQCQETVVSEYGPIEDAVYDPACDCYVRQPMAWETITFDCYQNASFTDNHLDPAKNKVFIWMHGFNVADDGASIWFDTMFKRLYWSKYDGDFLGISWEGNEGSINQFLTYYNKNVENAFQTAQAVADFVSTVASGKTKDIGAHSLGNMLMLEALRILDESSSQPVRNVVNMQAAVPGDVYEAESTSLVVQLLNSLNAWKGFFRPSIDAAQNSVLNTFSQEDEVLDGVLVLNEFIKPITGIVMFWLWDNNNQAYMHPQMEDALGLISVAGQHPSLGSTDVYINQLSSPYGIRDHSSMKNELFLDVEDFFITLRNTIQ